MKTKYQLVIIGNYDTFKKEVVDTFLVRATQLGIEKESLEIIYETNFDNDYRPNCPTVCLYFAKGGTFININILEKLINDAVFILPTVSDLNAFSSLVPPQLKPINGLRLGDVNDVESVVGRIMEGLSLLRASRRLFISYRRIESRSIAIQLYEYLDQCGFDVFLDTHSIRPGDIFQDELWHRLVDTDVVVLLDTPGFLESEWTEKELAKASAMNIGILQLIWPNHKQIPYSTLSYPYNLCASDFEKSDYQTKGASLIDLTLKSIASDVESLRARNLASRQDTLIQEFTSSAKRLNIKAYLQPEKFITVTKKDGKDLALIPTVGVPQAFTYNQTDELIKRIREHNLPEIFLLYDHRNIIQKWERHLTWLNLYLPVKSVKITEIETWMLKSNL
ncbi:MAG: toll/interleukin-1 receptor domain-containing protein [Ferruginibacter sp.]